MKNCGMIERMNKKKVSSSNFDLRRKILTFSLEQSEENERSEAKEEKKLFNQHFEKIKKINE